MKLVERTYLLRLTEEELNMALDALAADCVARPEYSRLNEFFDQIKLVKDRTLDYQLRERAGEA